MTDYLVSERLDSAHVKHLPMPIIVYVLLQIHGQIIKDQIQLAVLHKDVLKTKEIHIILDLHLT